MPKGRGSNERRRNRRLKDRPRYDLWVSVDAAHDHRMRRMSHGLGVKGPCLRGSWDHPHKAKR